ncbi:hypothetical protein N658DRAFT_49431 [Parathielavia hyrcaniae]|uniref:Uncharacterized protein n=1 Tax=Parathielavia hyrcaniae TaxID=113614 RepID=A0AAN6T2G1_9PEZI|nr:hypothetical protein N658DRAFT_49431 [Parathielavia hyrcaniae]
MSVLGIGIGIRTTFAFSQAAIKAATRRKWKKSTSQGEQKESRKTDDYVLRKHSQTKSSSRLTFLGSVHYTSAHTAIRLFVAARDGRSNVEGRNWPNWGRKVTKKRDNQFLSPPLSGISQRLISLCAANRALSVRQERFCCRKEGGLGGMAETGMRGGSPLQSERDIDVGGRSAAPLPMRWELRFPPESMQGPEPPEKISSLEASTTKFLDEAQRDASSCDRCA